MTFARPKAGTTVRGYGWRHQLTRARLLPGAYGRPCPWAGVDPRCPGLMLRGQALELDHTDDRTGYRGMAHADCNRRAGARKGRARQAARPAPSPTSRDW